MGEANGLLVQARQNPLIYTIIILIIATVLLFILLSFFLKAIEKKHSSPEWIEAHKKLPTTKKNVKHVAKEAELNSMEEKFLWEVCRKLSIPNLEFTSKDPQELDTYFKTQFQQLYEKNPEDKHIRLLFSIRFKLEKAREKNFYISSTKALKEGQELFYFDENSKKWIFTVVGNTRNGLLLQVPAELMIEEKKIPTLSKLNISFNTKTNISYGFAMRIVRYEKQKDESELMLASHSASLMPMQRRKSKRKEINNQCLFAAVKVAKDKNGRNFYEVKENRYKGILQDISATGARLLCPMPIKKAQHIYIDFALGESIKDHAIGRIVATNKSSEADKFVLHIEFTEIETAASNKIYAYIYGYLN